MNCYVIKVIFADQADDGSFESCIRAVYAFDEIDAVRAVMESMSPAVGVWPTITGLVIMSVKMNACTHTTTYEV